MDWYKKYEPRTLEEYIGNNEIKNIILNGVKIGLNSFIFYGDFGLGKSLLAKLLIKKMLGKSAKTNSLVINGSLITTKEAFFPKITPFLRTAPLFNKKQKIIVIDEADQLSQYIQKSLKKIMDDSNVVWIFITNHIKKIEKALQSRCTILHFKKHPVENIQKNLIRVYEKVKEDYIIENLEIDEEILFNLALKADGDMRKSIQLLQAYIMARTEIIAKKREPKEIEKKSPLIRAVVKNIEKMHNEVQKFRVVIDGKERRLTFEEIEKLSDRILPKPLTIKDRKFMEKAFENKRKKI